jgi:hypothetical protein
MTSQLTYDHSSVADYLLLPQSELDLKNTIE